MQISKLSTPSFGCQRCNYQQKSQQPAAHKQTAPAVTITRNALIAGLVGLLTNCNSCNDTYTISTTPEGNPVIFNQDGDTIDFMPRSVKKEYQERFGTLEGEIPNCSFTK